ncbi:uncharacterized protein FOMMEDRAFT_133902 [Fomitiporia mediterranea MF3/22]|uniref:uncharacterized protein n=1 Tax=Fomitiporia mediterranea (strain MF3/22) TaxID=694068 RepID=UPI0004407982|nr:uncharacterized protein FOMMEDRAFT_133902 [Fomitiporia mediterranea MF3/22]EJD02632.1 hypothetical protein FOMMEDRAFT_133902 [Fomitiporia mediterranea MF3/22]
MQYRDFNGIGGQARREEDKVIVYLSPKQPVPDIVPYELHEHIYPDDWTMRMTTLRDTAFRYYHPMFERVWIIVASLAVIILPLALYQVIFDAMFTNEQHTAEHYFEARFVSFAVFVGTFIFFWAPVLIWKAIGKRRLRNLTSAWERSDRASRPPSGYVPVWKAKMPTVFKSTCVVTITAPPNAKPSLFHPNAYMPSYINPPADSSDAYFYPYAPGKEGLPRMSVAGSLPGYQATPGQREFIDVKV